MATTGPLDSGPQLSKAVLILHSALPLVVGVYYFVATTVSYFTQSKTEEEKPPKRVLRNVLFWLVFGVPVTYAIEGAILLHASFSGVSTPPGEDSIIYVFASGLLWFTLLLGFSDSSSSPGYRFYGCWVVYLIGEIMLLSFCLTIARPRHGLVATIVGLQALRIVILILLCGMTLGSRVVPSKKSRDEEESSPLLGQGSQPLNDPQGIQQPPGTGDNNYGSINSVKSPKSGNGNTQADSENPGTDCDDKIKNQSTKDYIKSFTVLLPFFWPTGKIHLQLLYVGVGLCLIVNRVLNVLVPLQIGLITNILSKPNPTLPLKEISVFIALRLLDSSGGIEAIRGYLWLPLENYSYQRIGQAAFDKIMTLSCDFHDNKHSGSLWLSISRGQSIRYLVSSVLFQVGPMLVDLALAISVLYYLFDVYMALIIAAVVVTFLWSAGKILSLQKEKRREWIADLQKEQNILCETTGNWKTVSYFNRVPYEKSRYFSAMDSHMKSRLIYKLWNQMESIVQSFLLVFGLMAACFLAAYQVIQGNKPVGSFVMLLSYWAQLSGPLRFFASSFCGAVLDLVDAEDLLALLKRQPTVSDEEDAKKMILSTGEIEFRDVKFSYDNQRDIVRDINFKIAPGQTVALVGETGGGKSTIMKLISRFYDPKEGAVFIDGQDIRYVTLESLRANIGVVPQDPALFHDTIMNNIRYAKFDATDDEIFEACKAVALHEKFLSFSDGYETLVGERGMKLSGGELQRVAIARAIVKRPKIVLLDEATSSVDSETEAQIQESLGALSTGRTTFVIAHRLSTIRDADKILVIQDGRIVEQGTHESLLSDGGRYHRLWSRQGFFRSDDPEHQPDLIDVSDNREPISSNHDPDSQSIEPVEQKEHEPDLIDGSNDQQSGSFKPGPSNSGPSNPEPPIMSVRDPSANSGKLIKTWKPEAPEFVPCNISRWKPTPIISAPSLQYPTLSPYTANKQATGGVDKYSKIPTPVHNSKENAPKAVVSVIHGCNYAGSDSDGRKHVAGLVPSGEATKEPVSGNQQTAPPGVTTDADALQRDWIDRARYKRKRVTRRNMSKSDPAGVTADGKDDGYNDSSTPVGSRKGLIDRPSLGDSSPTLTATVDNSSNPRRRRRNRHLKNKSPRKPLLSVSNGLSDTPPATPSNPFTERFQPAPRRGTGIGRFPPAA